MTQLHRTSGRRGLGALLATTTMLLWGTLPLALEAMLRHLGPATVTWARFVGSAAVLFALLALRSLYTLLAKSVQQLHYLRHAVALILGFVGVKMTLEFFHFEVSHSTCHAHSAYYAHCASCAAFAHGAPSAHTAPTIAIQVGSVISLAVIVGLLLGGTLLSIVKNRSDRANDDLEPLNQGHHLI